MGRAWSARRWRLPVVGLLSSVAAFGLLGTLSPWTADVGPGAVRLAVGWHVGGGSTLGLPPLGDVRADTHDTPLAVNATLTSVDTERLQQTVSADKPADQLESNVRSDLTDSLPHFFVRSLLLTALVGLVVALLLARRDIPGLVAGTLTPVLLLAAMLGVTWRTYDIDAFEQPQFTGSLTEAPRVLASVRKHVNGIDDAKRRIGALSDQVSDLYRTTSTVPGEAEYGTNILHVSDLHSNPVGFELTKRLATSFGVDAIVDTGDVTSFGLPVESKVGDLLTSMPIPYYLVPGNHDSPEIRQQLAQTKGVTLLDNNTATVEDVQILGVGDPTFTATNEISTAEATKLERESAPAVKAQLEAHPGTDVLAVHSAVQAEASYGAVPLVISGHAHKRGVINGDGTTTLVVGSTGAGGVGAFSVAETPQYEAEVLHFDGNSLKAVDYVVVSGSDGNFTVSRSIAPVPSLPAGNNAQTEPDIKASRPTTTSTSTTSTTVVATGAG